MSLGGRTVQCVFILNHQGSCWVAECVLSKQSAFHPLDISAEVSPWPFSFGVVNCLLPLES